MTQKPNKLLLISITAILLLGHHQLFSQSSTIGNNRFPGFFLGWNGGIPGPLDIRNDIPGQNMNFFTGGALRQTILANGNVGIANFNPQFNLDVGMNINIDIGPNIQNQSYRINGRTVLQVPGQLNTLVGQGAGIALAVGTTFENTMVGNRAGFNSTTGAGNTFVGARAGESHDDGEFNTFVGARSGQFYVTGESNSFFGEHSGFRFVTGDFNTFLGDHAAQGANNARGDRNTIAGAFATPNITDASLNSVFGMESGLLLSTGEGNVYMGYLQVYKTMVITIPI